MRPSRGMGAIRPELKSKKRRDNTDFLEDGVRRPRRDNTDFTEYAEGGSVSRVNEAGNYTKPGMRKELFNRIKGQATQGTAAGQWSGRKSQLLAKQYKARGGGYRD